MTNTKVPTPTVEEAERVITHLLSYPDECEETLDVVRYIMQWMDFDRPTEAALARHARILRQPLPEGIRADIEHVPSKRHRTSIIVKGVLEGYLKWLRKNHPETGDDVDPDAPIPQEEIDLHNRRQMLAVNGFAEYPTLDELVRAHLVVTDYICKGDQFTQREALRKLHFLFTHAQKAVQNEGPHHSHNMLVHDNLGGTEQTEVCGYCGKTDEIELREPCPEVERMNREEDAYRENPCADIFLRSPVGKNDG